MDTRNEPATATDDDVMGGRDNEALRQSRAVAGLVAAGRGNPALTAKTVTNCWGSSPVAACARGVGSLIRDPAR
jgi:hypothetical protein